VLTFAEEIMLLLLEDESGRFIYVPEHSVNCVLSGAVLMDLALSGKIDTDLAREAIADLPEGAEHGESPAPERVYVPSSHAKAMDPDIMLVTGMRGAGKTFWWSALQNAAVRELVYRPAGQLPLKEPAEVARGFGITPDLERYPDKDVLTSLLHGVTGIDDLCQAKSQP